jgi:hypothetical protein
MQGTRATRPGRRNVVLACLAAMPLLGACGSDANQPLAPVTREPDPRPTPECTPGRTCGCAGGVGVSKCIGGVEACDCPTCPTLQVSQAPVVASCGGDPVGTWRLKDLYAAPQWTLTSAGRHVGTCDLRFEIAFVPHALMSLHESGSAEYFAEAAALRVSWSERCVTSKTPEFYCGADAWTGISNCEVSCDICSCDASLDAFESNSANGGGWAKQGSQLVIAPWGSSTALDYCVTGNVLELSGARSYLAYERVYPGVTPTHCELKDFGVVPGCDLFEKPPACTGEPPACDVQDLASCRDVNACTVNTAGRCTGPSLDCADFTACPAYCDDTGSACLGTTSCTVFDFEDCTAIGRDLHPDQPCTWQSTFCEGTPNPCSTFAPVACETQPGCHVEYL